MMDIVLQSVDFLLHVDRHLVDLVQNYGQWVYAILFVIVFCETGLVVTPFLPGDSLLFATGAIAAMGSISPYGIIVILAIAAILGDTANYVIGNYLGPKMFSRPKSWFFKPEHLERTHCFYSRYGAKTIIIARFVPIVRTFAPFVAGIGRMSYAKFIAYNVIGGIAWVAGFVCCGYFFGNLPLVKQHFSLVVLGIIVLSVMPAVVEVIRECRRPKSLPDSCGDEGKAMIEAEAELVAVRDREDQR